MLPPPQILIGRRQLGCTGLSHVPSPLQGVQRVQRPRCPQPAVPPAEDQLLGLDEELDLPDAAAAELQVRTGRREPVIHLVDMDLALDGMDVRNGGEVQAAAPDERLQGGEEFRPDLAVAGTDPGLDHGRPFPVLPHAFIIFEGRGHGHRCRCRGRVGPQPQVHAEHVAILGPLLQQVGQGPGQSQGHRRWLDPLCDGEPLRRIEDRHVDIAGIVELEGPVLAQRQAEQARCRTAGAIG